MKKIIAILLLIILYTPAIAALSPDVDMFTEACMIDMDNKGEDKAEKKSFKEYTSTDMTCHFSTMISSLEFDCHGHFLTPSPFLQYLAPPPDVSC